MWSLGVYLEQLSVAMLYLWHVKWEEVGAEGELSDFDRPSLLDEVNELDQLNL